MHNKSYYRNRNGDLDPHAKKIAWKNHDVAKIIKRKETILNDWNPINNHYLMDVASTLWTNVQWLNICRRNTKLLLRQQLAMIPRDEIAHELRVQNFTIVPQGSALPTPVNQSQIKLVA